MRLANKHSDNVAIGILNGNNCLLAGTYKYSLGEYMNVYKVERNNPIVPLMLGITFVHECTKILANKPKFWQTNQNSDKQTKILANKPSFFSGLWFICQDYYSIPKIGSCNRDKY